MPDDYLVRLDVFSGPLDLLLYLVRKEEVELYDLSLERLTAQYLEYLQSSGQLDLDLAGDFIATAAHLLYLKSRRLLPPEQRAEAVESPEEEEDPRWELIRQLLEYKKFKEVASHLSIQEAIRSDLFPRHTDAAHAVQSAAEELEGTRRLEEVSALDLITAFHRVLRRIEERRPAQRLITEERFTVAEKIEYVLDRAKEARESGALLLFEELFSQMASRLEVVVTFLALLELVRLKRLRLTQEFAFQPILITTSEEAVA